MKKVHVSTDSDYICISHLQEACQKNDLTRAEQLLKFVNPTKGVWEECFKNYRCKFITLFVKNNLYPSRDVFLTGVMTHSNFYDPFTIISRSLCRNAVYCLICVGKRLGQPYSHLFVLIAKHVWKESNNLWRWSFALEWGKKE